MASVELFIQLINFVSTIQQQLPTCPIRIRPDNITPLTAVRDLGIYIDSDLSRQTGMDMLFCQHAQAVFESD